MIHYGIPTIVSRPADAAQDGNALTADWACPLCRSLVDRSVGMHGLNLRRLVLVSEQDGVPCYGLRRGALLKGRSAQRRPSTDARVMAAMDKDRSDYRLMDVPVYDTYCANCRARVRVEVARAFGTTL